MNTYTATRRDKPSSFWNDDYASLYKIYVGIERDRNAQIFGLDIIDGYLGANESLAFKYQSKLENGIAYFEIEIVPAPAMNTYLKIHLNQLDAKSILVKTFKHGKCLGYQWTDLEGNILGKPETGKNELKALQS